MGVIVALVVLVVGALALGASGLYYGYSQRQKHLASGDSEDLPNEGGKAAARETDDGRAAGQQGRQGIDARSVAITGADSGPAPVPATGATDRPSNSGKSTASGDRLARADLPPSNPEPTTRPKKMRRLSPTQQLLGPWRCSFTSGMYKYPAKRCRIRKKKGKLMLEKLDGSQRIVGVLALKGNSMTFNGYLYCPDGAATSRAVAKFTRKGKNQWTGTLFFTEDGAMHRAAVVLDRGHGGLRSVPHKKQIW